VNKVLHAPLSRLRREAEREEGVVYLEVARTLFGLDEEPGAASGSGPDEPDAGEAEGEAGGGGPGGMHG
jgi:hypothetical protein